MEDSNEMINNEQNDVIDKNYLNHVSSHHINVFLNLYFKTKFEDVIVTKYEDEIQTVANSKDAKLLINFRKFDLNIKILEFNNLSLDVVALNKDWRNFVYKCLPERELKSCYSVDYAASKEENVENSL